MIKNIFGYRIGTVSDKILTANFLLKVNTFNYGETNPKRCKLCFEKAIITDIVFLFFMIFIYIKPSNRRFNHEFLYSTGFK